MIEATILATRLELTTDEQERERMKKHMRLYKEIVKKCGGSREKEAMEILEEKDLVQ